MGSEAGRNVWINVFWGRRQPSALLPAHSQPEMLLTIWAENAVMARLVGFSLRKSFGRALLLKAIYSLTSGL